MNAPFLSIIIPAFNEKSTLQDCLDSIHNSVEEFKTKVDPNLMVEYIVCDNNSTDSTAQIAKKNGAKVVFEPVNQISRARNTGAAAAQGEWLLFIDADSDLRFCLFKETLSHLKKSSIVAGGTLAAFEDLPLWGSCLTFLWNTFSRTFNIVNGAFIFVRSDAFKAIGGFNQNLYASEEIDFCMRIKLFGRARDLKFKVLTQHRHFTSNRKIKIYGFCGFLKLIYTILCKGPKSLYDPNNLELWYDGRR